MAGRAPASQSRQTACALRCCPLDELSMMPRFPWQLKRKVGWAESPGQQQDQAGAGLEEDLVSEDSSR
ncbi:hypothetical protein ACSS6W_009271 [Trichoderma asperelloides]